MIKLLVFIGLLQCLSVPITQAGDVNVGLGGLKQLKNPLGGKAQVLTEFEDSPITALPLVQDVLDTQERAEAGAPPNTKKERLLKKQSYEDNVLEEVEEYKPSTIEINERRNEAGYVYISGESEKELADGYCSDGDLKCEKDMLMWAAAPTDPKAAVDKKAKKAKRDKLYERAVKIGQKRGEQEMKKAGGPDPYGGLLPPHLVAREKEEGKDDAKKALEETKGTKTLKGSKKDKDDKGKKDEPDVATSPTA